MPAKGQRRKKQIVDTAKEMFMKNGFQSTHIGQVCDKLDIARGTVYQYFGNKKEILACILETVEEELEDIYDADDLGEFLGTKPGKDALHTFLSNRLSASIKAIISEPIVIKLMFKEIPGIDEEIIERLDQFTVHIKKTIVREIEELKRRGVYKKDVNSEVVSTLLVGGVMLLVHEYDKSGANILSKDVVSPVVTTLMSGIL